MSPAAPVNSTRFMFHSPCFACRQSYAAGSPGWQLALGQSAVALQAARQMRAHGLARLRRMAVPDRLMDTGMLLLDAHQILPLLLWRAHGHANALARDDVAAEVLEKLGEAWVAGGLAKAAMEGEVLVRGARAAVKGSLEGAQGGGDGRKPLRRDALGGERRRLHLDGEAQLHHLQHVADRAQAVRVDAE